MQTSIPGKVAHTDVAVDRPLLPLFEAISNSMQAVELARKTCKEAGAIVVSLVRTETLWDEVAGPVVGFIVEDDGAGFDKENYNSFCTADSQYKASLGGKGLGRFTWLRVFKRAHVESVYEKGGEYRRRTFDFSEQDAPDVCEDQPSDGPRRTSIRVESLNPSYNGIIPPLVDDIAEEIVEHCLPLLAAANAPALTLIDRGEKTDLNQFFRDYFQQDATEKAFKVMDSEFFVTIYRSRRGSHRLIFTAHSRAVVTVQLAKWVPNLLPRGSGDQSFAAACVVRGSALDYSVDSTRTRFNLPRDDRSSTKSHTPHFRGIQAGAVEEIKVAFAKELDDSAQAVKRQAHRIIAQERPEFAGLLPKLDEIVASLPAGAPDSKLEDELARVSAERSTARRHQMRTLFAKITSQVQSQEQRADEIVQQLMVTVGDEEKHALAQHVAYRKAVIEVFEQSLKWEADTKAYDLESVLHRLVCPMRVEGHQLRTPEEHHLWLIDERLSFHSFLASDKELRHLHRLESMSRLRPDILIWDVVWTLAAGDSPHSSLTLLEFKKPQRDDYTLDKNPYTQVREQIEAIRESKIRTFDGRDLNPDRKCAAYAYIIADPTPTLRKVLKTFEFETMPDDQGFFVYSESLKAYIEVLSYDKVVSDAKKRNKILFDKLGLTRAV